MVTISERRGEITDLNPDNNAFEIISNADIEMVAKVLRETDIDYTWIDKLSNILSSLSDSIIFDSSNCIEYIKDITIVTEFLSLSNMEILLEHYDNKEKAVLNNITIDYKKQTIAVLLTKLTDCKLPIPVATFFRNKSIDEILTEL